MKVSEVVVSSSYSRCSVSTYSSISKVDIRKRWIKDRDLFMAELSIDGIETCKRIVTPVVIKNIEYPTDNKPIYMMDAITGTLYDIATGDCLTSDDIQMIRFTPKKGLGEELFRMKLNHKELSND